jgi:hypothetical protein
VALSTINSVCRRAAEGRFPRLHDRHDLWRILATVTSRKGAEVYRYNGQSTYDDDIPEQVISREPSPELAVQVSDEVRRLLEALPNDGYRTIAQKNWRVTPTPKSLRSWVAQLRTSSSSSATSAPVGFP